VVYLTLFGLEAEENHAISQPVHPISGPRFEPGTFRLQVRSASHFPTTFRFQSRAVSDVLGPKRAGLTVASATSRNCRVAAL
jgi:hypothetical protein